MKGQLRRFRRTPAPAPDAAADPSATADGTAEQQPAAAPVPAGGDLAPGTGFAQRGRARRRLRYLRRVRELGFRDLGGLVYDQHRFERRNDDLLRAKVDRLAAVDGELRALQRVLGDGRSITELREPGVSGCPRCGELHGSEARFCPSCGLPQGEARSYRRPAPEPPAAPGPEQPPATTPAPAGQQPPATTPAGEPPPPHQALPEPGAGGAQEHPRAAPEEQPTARHEASSSGS